MRKTRKHPKIKRPRPGASRSPRDSRAIAKQMRDTAQVLDRDARALRIAARAIDPRGRPPKDDAARLRAPQAGM